MKGKKLRTKAAPSESLESVRAEIRDLTESIFNLAKARQALSERVALIKQSKRLSVENKEVESKLIDSMEEYASSIGLDPMFARHITKNLVEASKSAQRRAIYFEKIKESLALQGVRRVGVVGAGRMGGWFATYFKSLVESVTLYDSNRKFGRKRAKELGCKFSKSLYDIGSLDLILVAVPISKTIQVTKVLLKHVEKRTKTRIIEVSSVKEELIKGMGKRSADLYSIHPLFGSSADQFGENSLIVVGSSRNQDDFVEGLFPHFKILHLNATEHDKLMTLLLSLPHALALTFAGIVSEKKLQNHVSSPSFDGLLQIAKKTLSENPRVYYEIQSLNRHNQEMLREFKKSVEKLDRLLSRGDYARFARFFSKTRKRLGE